ncbi:unnamed protein product, partial [Mesorhabditis spiculigera]
MQGHVEVPSDETATVAELERNWKEEYMRTKDGRLQTFVTHYAGEAPVQDVSLHGVEIEANREERTLHIHGGKEHIKILLRIKKCDTAETFDKWRQALLSHAAASNLDQFVTPRIVILELGSTSIRAGVLYQKPLLPQVFFPAIGCILDNGQIVVGNQAYEPENRQRGELVRPIQCDPSVERYSMDKEVTKACIERAIRDLAVVSIPMGAQQIRDSLRTSLASHNNGLFSFQTPCERLILRYVMEHSAYVPENYETESGEKKSISLTPFKPTSSMPREFEIDSSRFTCTEGLFRPKKWQLESKGIHHLIHDAVTQSPIDSRRNLYKNIYLAGGASLLPGLAEKVETELETVLPNTINAQVHISPWRYHAAFLGAQVVAAGASSLAALSSPESLPSTRAVDLSGHSAALCQRLLGLNPVQKQLCTENPLIIQYVARGIREALYHCQDQFKNERWNCSDRHEVITTPHGEFRDILGKTLRSASREGAFLTAIATAGIVYEVTKGCSTGNLSQCGCDSQPDIQKYIDTDVHNEPRSHPAAGHHRLNQRSLNTFSWGGCSDNVPYGVKFTREFLDKFETQQFENLDQDVRRLVHKHNFFVGREQIAQNIKRTCRCHGVSGSCEFKTCWLSMPKFGEVAEMLKKRYQHFAVQVAKRVKKRLRRKERGERAQMPIRGNELAFLQKSPSYCERNDTLGILGTLGRECVHRSHNADDCDLLCCGRGYNTRSERKKTQCQCKFVWCCQVKCKECIDDVTVHTCK